MYFVTENPNHIYYHAPPDRRGMPSVILSRGDEDDGLGPLPLKWEKAYTENGESYFIEYVHIYHFSVHTANTYINILVTIQVRHIGWTLV